MRSGLLNERLTVYELTTTTDANGASAPIMSVKGSYWCRMVSNRHNRSENDVDRVVYNPDVRLELRASVPIIDSDIIEKDDIRYVIDIIEKDHNLDIQTLYCTRYEQ